jgi:hypothetical protein
MKPRKKKEIRKQKNLLTQNPIYFGHIRHSGMETTLWGLKSHRGGTREHPCITHFLKLNNILYMSKY